VYVGNDFVTRSNLKGNKITGLFRAYYFVVAYMLFRDLFDFKPS
jgi:hypothetical protein